MIPVERTILFEEVSKFYGEVLGVNRVSFRLEPGITSLVGPNGSGKSTLMNLMTGLLRPSRGRVRVLGADPEQPEALQRLVGYATQYDSFPAGLTGYRFLFSYLLLRGLARAEADELAWEALEQVGLGEAAERRIAGYSKGMRQRVKLAHAICHRPPVLVLDEPLNGLDPVSRSEMIALFRELASRGLHVIVSSHILHEVDVISDRVVLVNAGYVVAEGAITEVREEMDRHPIQILVRCDRPSLLASRLFEQDHVVEARLGDGGELLVKTWDSDRFYLVLNDMVLEHGLEVESVAPADADVEAVYRYLIDEPGATR